MRASNYLYGDDSDAVTMIFHTKHITYDAHIKAGEIFSEIKSLGARTLTNEKNK